MFNWIFAFAHLLLLAGILGYTLYSLIEGQILRFALLALLLTIYYFLVLHKAVKKEIDRKRKS